MADLTGKRFYISTEEAEYFESRSMKCLDSPPTSGTHKVGDIVISSTQADGLFGWVCTIEGTPGTWSEIGFGGDISSEDLYGVVFQGDDIKDINYTLESLYGDSVVFQGDKIDDIDFGLDNMFEDKILLQGDDVENIDYGLGSVLGGKIAFQGDDIDNIDYTLESKYDKKIGSLSNLKTDDKSSLVSAINELKLLYNELKGLLDSLNKE